MLRRSELINSQQNNIEKILIEDDVWFGAHIVVTAGSLIGTGAVIGANSVVTKDVKAFTISAGVPAKYIKNRR